MSSARTYDAALPLPSVFVAKMKSVNDCRGVIFHYPFSGSSDYEGCPLCSFFIIPAAGLVAGLWMSRHSCRTGEFYQIRRGESPQTAFAEEFAGAEMPGARRVGVQKCGAWEHTPSRTGQPNRASLTAAGNVRVLATPASVRRRSFIWRTPSAPMSHCADWQEGPVSRNRPFSKYQT